MVTADHGPAVSGAHNTIICARAGKDLVSSLTSGLLTIVSLLLLQGNNSGVMLPQCSRLLLGAPGYKCPEQMLFRASWLVCEARKTYHTQGSVGLFLLQGDRFGGALDAAAKMFSKAFDSGIIPMEFVNKMKKEGKLIMGIGHRVKSVSFSC